MRRHLLPFIPGGESAMPQFDDKHLANYYTNKIVESKESCLELLKKYSIHPPDDAEGYKGDNETPVQGVRQARIDIDKKVAYLSLGKAKKGGSWITGNEGGKTLYGVATYVETADAIPVYWLPWDAGGAVISIKIPKKGTRARGLPDPDRFFTAAINGCSVFFEGNQDSPKVYHCGGPTYTNTADDGAKFWRDRVKELSPDDRTRREVNKTHYVRHDDYTTEVPHSTLKDQTVKKHSTKHAKRYQDWLKDQGRKELEIHEISPWGCVMGIRDDDGHWKFYLQENATVTYYVLKKKYSLFGKRFGPRVREQETDPTGAEIARTRLISRPIQFTEVYPNRVKGVRINHALPTWSG
jgi:hypothetical protein